ncbi:MAG TPA: 6-carboxytetrahydropterin synthase, partial [Bacteroidetes bacterium]|nr:6-carboxytetrahydropterin synthase [Bacteroidota bacterium]
MAYLTRRERFSSAHRLFNPEMPDDKNYELYGNCSHPNWHGHNYELYVTVKGQVDPNIGYVVNLKSLSSIIKELVIAKVDHKNLNIDVDFLQGVIPSTENIAISIWNILSEPISKLGAHIH